MSLPVIKLSGTPYDQGVTHGEALKDRIDHNLDVYFNRFAKEVGLSREAAMACADQFLQTIEAQTPDYHDGMRGIAAGAGVDLRALGALNVRYEILYYQFGVQAMADGCTAFAVLPEASENGHLLLGQNWDWIPQVQGAVLHTVEEDLEVLSFTEAGIFGGKIGLNSAGLGLAINGMTSTDDHWERMHKPFHVRCYEILRSRHFDDAVNVVSQEERVCATNYLVAQTPDKVVDIEAAPTRLRMITCERGRLAHTNHFFDPHALGIVEPPLDNRIHSRNRQARMTELLNGKDALSLDDLEGFLKDREGFPYSICRHEDPELPPDKRYITVTSVMMDLHARKMWLTDGPPDTAAFQHVALDA